MDSKRIRWGFHGHAWIVVDAVIFLVALSISAWVVPALRLLHVLQGMLYIVIVILAGRNSIWGLGAGVSVACTCFLIFACLAVALKQPRAQGKWLEVRGRRDRRTRLYGADHRRGQATLAPGLSDKTHGGRRTLR